MSKFGDISSTEPLATAPRRAKPLRWVLLFVLLSPFLFDGGKLVVARWQGLFGAAPFVQTPALDFASDTYRSVVASAGRPGSIFHRVPWRTDHVVLAMLACAALGCAFLRRGP